jgi:hypothetical protein
MILSRQRMEVQVWIYFNQRYVRHPMCGFELYGVNVPVVREIMFWSPIFNPKLTYALRIEYLIQRRLRVVNLLLIVAYMNWGADK